MSDLFSTPSRGAPSHMASVQAEEAIALLNEHFSPVLKAAMEAPRLWSEENVRSDFASRPPTLLQLTELMSFTRSIEDTEGEAPSYRKTNECIDPACPNTRLFLEGTMQENPESVRYRYETVLIQGVFKVLASQKTCHLVVVGAGHLSDTMIMLTKFFQAVPRDFSGKITLSLIDTAYDEGTDFSPLVHLIENFSPRNLQFDLSAYSSCIQLLKHSTTSIDIVNVADASWGDDHRVMAATYLDGELQGGILDRLVLTMLQDDFFSLLTPLCVPGRTLYYELGAWVTEEGADDSFLGLYRCSRRVTFRQMIAELQDRFVSLEGILNSDSSDRLALCVEILNRSQQWWARFRKIVYPAAVDKDADVEDYVMGSCSAGFFADGRRECHCSKPYFLLSSLPSEEDSGLSSATASDGASEVGSPLLDPDSLESDSVSDSSEEGELVRPSKRRKG